MSGDIQDLINKCPYIPISKQTLVRLASLLETDHNVIFISTFTDEQLCSLGQDLITLYSFCKIMIGNQM